MLKSLCLIVLLGLSANAIAQDALDEEIWPRDIFDLVTRPSHRLEGGHPTQTLS
jgi:hypothetical protein